MNDEKLNSLIEENRKGDFTLDCGDMPIGTPVEYHLKRLSFLLGTVLYRSTFMLPEDDPDRRSYLEKAHTYFNTITVPIFWHTLEPEQGAYDDTPYRLLTDWCKAHDKRIFGHALLYGWDGPDDCDREDANLNFIQPWVRSLNREQLEKAMKTQLERALERFSDKIKEFVLINEVLGKTALEPHDYFSQILGFKNLEPYFQWAEVLAPELCYYCNENSILFGDKTEQYVEMIRALLDAGCKVGGIGIQGHMMKDTIPSDEKMWAALEALSVFKLPLRVTEFGIQTKDEEQYAEDMVRFYRLCMAHPAVQGIIRWGMWEPEMWCRDWPVQECHLWNNDWSTTPGGKRYIELVTKEWVSKGSGEVDSRGKFRFRGFHGTYEITMRGKSCQVELDSKNRSVSIKL